MSINSQAEDELSWRALEDNIQVTQFTSSSSDRSKVYVKKFNAYKKNPKRNLTIFLLHDLGQHHGRFLSFVNWSRQHLPGVSFVAMDFIGHGLSSGTRGHVEKFECIVKDLLFLLSHTEKKNDEFEKWLILGHGLGGLVALDLINRYQETVENKIDGLIISNFILKFSSYVLQVESRVASLSSGINKLLSHLRPIRIFKGSEILSRPKDILLYDQDPLLVHRPTLVTIKEIQNKLIYIYQDSYFLGKPLLMLKSDSDGQLISGGIDYFVKGIKKELLTEKKYSLMKHDLYNEIDKEVVYQDIMNWVKLYEN